MTFNPSIPLNSDSPSIFPAQSQTNYTRLQTLLGADHQFNTTAAANDGWHNLIHMTQQSPASAPVAATGRLYSKVSAGQMQLFFMDDTAVASKNYQITPTLPIRAAVNFDAAGTIRGSAYNVLSVTKNGNGDYTVNFLVASPMPDNNYIVLVTGMRDTVGLASIGSVRGGVYATSVTTASVRVTFSGETNSSSGISLKDTVMGNVVVFSLT